MEIRKMRPRSTKQRKISNYFTQWGYNSNEKKKNERKSLPEINNENDSVGRKSKYVLKEKYTIQELLKSLNFLWDKLNAKSEYREGFFNNLSNFPESEQFAIIMQEKNDIKKLIDYLYETKKEIINRDTYISLLKKYNNSLENNPNNETVLNNILKEVISNIKKLRNNAINIVRKIMILKKIINKYENIGKLDIKTLKQVFLYSPNYINKMTNELLFLQNSAISKYIEMDNSDIDQFLSNCAPNPSSKNNRKLTVPMTEEHLNVISELKDWISKESNLTEQKNEIESNNYFSSIHDIQKMIALKKIDAKNKRMFANNEINGNKRNKNIFSGINNFKNSRPKLKNKIIFYNDSSNFQNKIIKIEREKIEPLTEEKFISNLDQLKTEYFIFNNKNGQRKPSLKEPKEKIKFLKEKLKEEEKKRINAEKDNSILKNKIKELESKIEEKDDNILKKKIRELEIKIAEKDDIINKNKENVEKIENIEKKLSDEEELRKSGEKKIEELNLKIKDLEKRIIPDNDNNNNNILENKIKELETKIEEKDDIINKNNEKIKKLEVKLNKEENLRKSREKEIENLNLEIKNLEEKINNLINVNYKIDFYRGNISNLVNYLKEEEILEKIPDFLKRCFLIDDSIYNEDYYFKGIFPKIVVSTDKKDENDVKGLCALYYEGDENLTNNSILRIYTIYASEYSDNQIINMVNFVKNNMMFGRLEVYLLYDKIEKGYVVNQEAKNLFQKKLGFKWMCVTNDEKLQQKFIRLYYSKETDNQDNAQSNNHIINNFKMDTMTIITVNNKEKKDLLKNLVPSTNQNSELFNINYNKFINPNPIYYLINENDKINCVYNQSEKKDELIKTREKIGRFVLSEINWKEENNERKIQELDFNIEKSVFKEIKDYYNTKNINCLCDLYKNNLSFNFETGYSILIDDIYYNRISSSKIKIIKETKTNSLFFLIPSNDNTVFFYVSKANRKIKKLLIDSSKNIYDKFLDFRLCSQKEIISFSTTSFRDPLFIPQIKRYDTKTIYIPTFSFNTHLFSYNFEDIKKNVKISDANNNENLFITSVDEYMNVAFYPDSNISNSFSVIPVEDKKSSIIIDGAFIIGIFDNDIINQNQLPLLQFLYVSEDHFLTKNNYNPEYSS